MESTRGGSVRSRLIVRAVVAAVLLVGCSVGSQGSTSRRPDRSEGWAGAAPTATRPLDGAGANPRHPAWGGAGRPYRRVAGAHYGDGIGSVAEGPSPRALSNRVFADDAQNTFSENGVTQWATAWAQFVDHSIGLRSIDRDPTASHAGALAFDPADPLERFRNDFGALSFARTPAAPGTGTGTDRPRDQLNTVDSYLDASAVYGSGPERLEWLREGPVNGDLSDNGARLLLPDGLLPTVGARGDATTAPPVDVDGRLRATPDRAVVAGDARANENLSLTAVQLLFAREHNRIVDALPDELSEQARFDIARRVVGATQQWVTYHEFLPSLGVRLDRYRGFDPDVDPTVSNEFATVGFRAHSMIHGEVEPVAPAAEVTDEQVAAAEAAGIEVETEAEEVPADGTPGGAPTGEDGDAAGEGDEPGGDVTFVVPLGIASFNPDLLGRMGLGPVLRGIASESQYNNDEQIDDQLRSVLFQVPMPGVADPVACLDGAEMPDCFHGVVDLGALDVARGRDHGMATYNEMRVAYGLDPVDDFTGVTGEDTDEFPDDPEIDAARPIDDPDILDVVELRDRTGAVVPLGTPEADTDAVDQVRRTTLAARLSALYGGDVATLDAFVGMVSEPHGDGAEMGELQLAMWRDEFEHLRDGDPWFYGNDPQLETIRRRYGIDFRRSLAQVITANSSVGGDVLQDNVFRLPDAQELTVRPPRDELRTTDHGRRPRARR